MTNTPSFRAQLLTRRTYNRPLDEGGFVFETWEQTVDRVIGHQAWLWNRALGLGDFSVATTNAMQEELEELRQLMLDRKISVSGRTLWLGGTEIAKKREASQFNCSFGKIETVYDVVDAFWLLLQGCGVGFEPITGQLNGFTKELEIEVIRSCNPTTKGREENEEIVMDDSTGKRIWSISIGDSAEAWAKAAGKLLAMSEPVDKLILDFTEIRGPGIRLKGYGWISSGDATISKAFTEIAKLRNARVGRQLTRMDILDLMNWLGTTLSSRRSAEIALMPHGDPEAEEFAKAKKDYWLHNNEHRTQSNNSIVFNSKPSKYELRGLFQQMISAGGSEPGFINGEAARKRAEWFKGCNPCAEILLGNKSFCNLVEIDMAKFTNDFAGLLRATRLAARANYRQTCVNLKDGVLSDAWHELNGFLRLCGVGMTGIVKWMDQLLPSQDASTHLQMFRKAAVDGARGMADELGLPHPRAVTTVKPSGTLGKIMDTTEGVHRPLGKYIFNNVNFSKHDPLVPMLRDANYKIIDHPTDPTAVVVTLPVEYEGVQFTTVEKEVPVWNFEETEIVDSKSVTVEVNLESAVEQLERYKLLMDNYVDHNCSITVSYDPSEVDDIVDWLDANWDTYVGVSWLFRNDPTKTAEDLGYQYLPQEVVTKERYEAYVKTLKEIDLDAGNSHAMVDDGGCSTGACPIR